MKEIESVEAVAKANESVKGITPTNLITTVDRESLRESIAEEYLDTVKSAVGKGDYSGEVTKGKKLFIVLGRAASGKTKLVEGYSKKFGGRIFDNDSIKGELPEFYNGVGAGIVHEESSEILDERIISKEILNKKSKHYGENAVLAIVGKKITSIRKYATMFKKEGYEVYLIHNDLPVEKCLQRAFGRFCEEGRLVNFNYVNSLIDDNKQQWSPLTNYNQIKKEEYIDGYAGYSNEVGFGENPKSLEDSKGIKLGRNDYSLSGIIERQGVRSTIVARNLQREGSRGSEKSARSNTDDIDGGLDSSRTDSVDTTSINFRGARLSLQDSNGNTLTKSQQEYFKNSKVIDKKGNLLRVYHGTPTAGFTMFDTSRSGFAWFSPSLNYAKFYTWEGKDAPMEKIYECYVNIEKMLDLGNIDNRVVDNGKITPAFERLAKKVNLSAEELHKIDKEATHIHGIVSTPKFAKIIEGLGYDGIRAWESGFTTFAILNPDQAKLTTNKKPTANPDIRFSKTITQADVQALRSIGRKSINDFTQEELDITQNWAIKYKEELGVKSPFFRAWFGDWREFDTNAVVETIVNKEIISLRFANECRSHP